MVSVRSCTHSREKSNQWWCKLRSFDVKWLPTMNLNFFSSFVAAQLPLLTSFFPVNQNSPHTSHIINKFVSQAAMKASQFTRALYMVNVVDIVNWKWAPCDMNYASNFVRKFNYFHDEPFLRGMCVILFTLHDVKLSLTHTHMSCHAVQTKGVLIVCDARHINNCWKPQKK